MSLIAIWKASTWQIIFDLLSVLFVMFSCVFVTFQYSVQGQVWYLIVLFPDLCLLLYFFYFLFFYKNGDFCTSANVCTDAEKFDGFWDVVGSRSKLLTAFI